MRIFVFIVASLILVSCKKNNEIQVPDQPAQTISNVFYGNDPKQKMDVYLPANRNATATKVIILVHGGGWTEGDKDDFAGYIAILQQRLPDYAIVNINYRLAAANTNLFPAQENDIKSAVEFVVSKANEYKISQRIVLLGASAGAHLALLYGYKYTTPVIIKAIISFFGPTDLVEMYNNPPNPLVPLLLKTVTGTTPIENLSIYTQSSSINFITNQSPPTLLLHGGADNLVSVSQSTLLQSKLQQSGIVNQLVIYPTEGHGWLGANLNDSFNRIDTFLKANVN
jgi:acetyl esterase/lipase